MKGREGEREEGERGREREKEEEGRVSAGERELEIVEDTPCHYNSPHTQESGNVKDHTLFCFSLLTLTYTHTCTFRMRWI